MILVADSGSTKADWIAGANGAVQATFHTKGFNPFFHNREFIIRELQSAAGFSEIRSQVKEVYFFGAGCSSVERNEIIAAALREFFIEANVIVEHDMLGTALAVCDGKPGVACILGTGSNICYFNGTSISETRHGLGYIIGDEGSGSYYGKKILAWYLYRILPADLHESFQSRYNLDKESIIKSVYKDPDPNVFLASFASFLSDHMHHSFIQQLVTKGTTEFFDTNVLSYQESSSVPVHFVGSIAWFFRDVISIVAAEKNITVGKIIQKPVTGLAAYFLNGGKMP